MGLTKLQGGVVGFVLIIVVLIFGRGLLYKNVPTRIHSGNLPVPDPMRNSLFDNTQDSVQNPSSILQQQRNILSLNNNLTNEDGYTKNFIYLLQTEHCIKEHMIKPGALADPSDRDIIVLSFKQKCEDKSLKHITYILDTSATWTTGRSQLYYAAKSTGNRYRYYVFMDDDVVFKWMQGSRGRQDSAYRGYEKYLLDTEPPMMALDNEDWSLVGRIFNKRNVKQCHEGGSQPGYFYAVWFDAECNAFHDRAVDYILKPVLPIWTRYDSSSWWLAQWYVNYMTDLAFHGQGVLNSQILSHNSQHRSYPKRIHDGKTLATIAEDVLEKAVPPEYKEPARKLLDRWIKLYVNIPQTVDDTFCYPIPPPKPPLVPFVALKAL